MSFVNGRTLKDMEVPEITEAAKGVWFPTRGLDIERDYNQQQPEAQIKFSFTCKRVAINNPNFDGHVFTLSFPPKCWVDDEVHRTAYTTASTQAVGQNMEK